MYKIMIVEDEVLELEALEKIIRNNCPQFSNVMVAGNGDQVLAILGTYVPDIVLMDIHLGSFNGLDLAAIIREENPDVRIIVITAYDQFNYAQKGVKIGIADYLLKPVNTSDLLEAIEKQIAVLEEQKENILRQARQRVNHSDIRNLFSCCFTGNVMNGLVTPELQEMLDLMHIPNKKMCVFVISYKIDENELTQAEKITIKKIIVEAIFKRDNKCHMFYNIMDSENITLCCFFHENEEANTINITKVLHRQIISEVHISVKIGCSEIVKQISDLSMAYRHAMLALKMGNECMNQYTDYWAESQRQEEVEISIDILISYMMQDNIHELSNYIKAILIKKDEMGIPFVDIKSQSTRIWFDLTTDLNYQVSLKKFDCEEDIIQPVYHMLNTGCIADLADIFISSAEKIMGIITKTVKNNSNYICQRARDYIKAHSTEQLSLTFIAEILNISPYYLSRIFKDAFGLNIIDYLNQVRINDAKERLSKGEESVKNIAFEVGFTDPNYFCRTFKKYMGVTPSVYRSVNR